MTRLQFDHMAKLAGGYDKWMLNLRNDGFDVYFATVMFDWSRFPKLSVHLMHAALRCYHSSLTSRFYRYPRKRPIYELPLLELFFETASQKQRAISGNNVWGGHFHGFLATPPREKIRHSFESIRDSVAASTRDIHPCFLRVDLRVPRNCEDIASYAMKERPRRGCHRSGQNDFFRPYRHEEMWSALKKFEQRPRG